MKKNCLVGGSSIYNHGEAMKKISISQASLLILVLLFFYSSICSATTLNFTGPYEMQNWTASGTGTESISPVSGPTNTAIFSYDKTGDFSGAWAFLTTADESGTVSFSWYWEGFHSWYRATGSLFFRSGTTDTLLQTVGSTFDVNDNYNASVTAGEDFGFYITGSNGDSARTLRGNLEITNFLATGNPVPEPATMLLFGTGLVGLAGISIRRKKK